VSQLKSRFSRLAREPLVHFLALGALLFLVFHWRGSGGPGSDRIVITPGQMDAMVASFARTWQRPPTEPELKGLLDDYVREEMATREAVAIGLDRDDTIIRRRLRQKLEFLAADSVDATPPTDAELQAWLSAHSDTFRTEAEVVFRQVYLNPERRRASLEVDAGRLLARLSAAGPDVDITALGDPLMLSREVGRSPRSDVVRQFGDEFADGIMKVTPGRWEGPLTSGFGLHLVFVRERSQGHMPTLAEARPLVEREFLSARRTRELAAMYERMLERYRVTMEKRPGEPQTPGAVAEHARGGSR
jgi:PPIC-type PPIASE domain